MTLESWLEEKFRALEARIEALENARDEKKVQGALADLAAQVQATPSNPAEPEP